MLSSEMQFLNHSMVLRARSIHKASIFRRQSRLPFRKFASTKENAAYEYVDKAEPENHKFDYDLIVIGGGSGGLACSQEAAKFQKKVAVVDFVKPSPLKTSWGLGGTCVNVGCIPKKLMHQAGLLGVGLKDSTSFGWQVPIDKVTHNWENMIQKIQNHIKSLNFGYRVKLRESEVKYINAFAKFKDPHTIEIVNSKNEMSTFSSRRFLVAVGGRPRYLDIPGAKEYAITSDDLFSMKKPPGKTLIVGASYVALETAGFLTELGYDTTVMARSIFLRGFDQQMSHMVVEYMKNHNTKFIQSAIPTKIEKNSEGKLVVTWQTTENKILKDEFETVMLAVGRTPQTRGIGLENAGVVLNQSSKIPVINERTNVPHIYALGDVIEQLELTPPAILAGRLLARRLYNGSTELMDYKNIPTTIFTPLEYSCCGLTEEDAIPIYGDENIEVYHAHFKPLEWTVPGREDNACYAKIICNKKDEERILGFHYVGPNAGEVMQGFALALKLGARKRDLESTVGIHPTVAEELLLVRITKRSGEDPMKTGC